jgi:acetyl esterase/lipase
MKTNPPYPPLRVPAREIPVPTTVSAEAQASLGMGRMQSAPYPDQNDIAAWRALIAEGDRMILPLAQARVGHLPVDVEEVEIDGARVFVVTPRELRSRERVYLDIHGGALIMGGGDCCRAAGIGNAVLTGMQVWAVDYRMPPEAPYPIGLDDCVAVYRALLRDHRPGAIAVGGASAGGNLAAATVLKARDQGPPLPSALVLLSPELDLTESGDSFQTNLGIDTVLSGSLMPANLLYAGKHDRRDPYLSPLFGDFSKGFPPTLLTAGTRDLFLSNAVRMHRALRALNIPAELYVLEAAPHGGFWGAPEQLEIEKEVRRFVDGYCLA